ncbi:X-ray repair cross-complementing protein 5-like [Anticarsia gemmatalis]|uniref:X-ray repair cross-complementing protein 5-like n=1 Tax=Anticarsia gemmatalis TaxID=129554 RepID=UPI003F75E9C4
MALHEGIIIILDIGRNVATPEEKNEKSFFEKAKECAARIIERKVMSEGKSVIAIILLGSKKTNNNMALQYPGTFKHIDIMTEFETPTWQMIRNLPEKPSDSKGDWFDSLIVAADYYKNGISGMKFSSKKIILMTNFKRLPAFDPDSIEQVLNGFKEEDYEVDIIGPNIYSDDHDKESIELARQFVEVTQGATETFENTMQYLLFHKKRTVKAMPWNVDLSIGPNIKIPVSTFLRIKDEPVVKKWDKSVKDPVSNSTSTSEAIVKSKEFFNPENKKVDEDNKIKGYHYGQKIIPFDEHDETMLYKSGEKSLTVYGFTNAKNIQWQTLNGDGLQYMFGRKGDRKAQEAVRCLVECLHELNLVGIVRKVHNNNNAPKMYALMPVIDTNNFVCLSMAAVCFKEDIKQMSFPTTNLKKHRCNDEQVNAFVDLINAMDLTNAYDDTYDDAEAFPIAECVSPSAQYVLDCIAYRAMNPDKPLPKPKQEILSLFEVPPMLLKKAKDPIDKIKILFPLKNVEPKPKRSKNIPLDIDLIQPIDVKTEDGEAADVKIQMPAHQAPVVVKNIGTFDPVGDYKALKNQNKSLAELGPEMIKAIEDMINYNINGNYSKAIDSMKILRSEYVSSDPGVYNAWMQKLKADLIDSDHKDILDLIVENKASFILKSENELSTYDSEYSHEESQLYENDTIPQSAELTISSEVQDMFDD